MYSPSKRISALILASVSSLIIVILASVSSMSIVLRIFSSLSIPSIVLLTSVTQLFYK